MTVAAWKAMLAIALGSLLGALLRQGMVIALDDVDDGVPHLAIIVSGLGGAVLGALTGWVATTPRLENGRRQLLLISLLATLGTFAAAGVLEALPNSPATRQALLYTGTLHIGVTIVASALGLALTRWLRERHPSG